MAAYVARVVGVIGVLQVYLQSPTRSFRIVGFYLLFSALLDAVRVYTLWHLYTHSTHGALERSLLGIQTAIVALAAATLVFEAAVSRRSSKDDKSAEGVKVDEENSSTLGRLSFGWVWPLLTFGSTSGITDDSLKHINYHQYATHRESKAAPARRGAGRFFSVAIFQYFLAFLLQMGASVSKLGQPAIIGGVMSYLQYGGEASVGRWLVLAMFIEWVHLSSSSARTWLTLHVCPVSWQSHCSAPIEIISLTR